MNESDSATLVLVGWDFRTAPVDLREKLAFSPEAAREALAEVRKRGLLTEGVIVSTCNRSELYGIASDPGRDSADELTRFVAEFQRLSSNAIEGSRFGLRGLDAARHLFRVASGLESLALGEDQILGQVREAFRLASGAGSTRTVLHRLFQKAVETGKRVRAETRLASRPTSIPGVAMELAQKIYEDVANRSFLVIGAGETGSIFFDLLLGRGARKIHIVNRTFEKARMLSARGGTARRWEEIPELLPEADVVVCATTSPEPVLSAEMVRRALVARRGQPMYLLDLGVPRNIDPSARLIENAFLSGVDDLRDVADQNRAERERDVPAADRIVEEELSDFFGWLGTLAVVPTLAALREKFDRICADVFDAEISRMSQLAPADRERIERIAHSLVKSLLRDPTAGLKDEADPSRRLDRAEAIRHLFRLDSDTRDR